MDETTPAPTEEQMNTVHTALCNARANGYDPDEFSERELAFDLDYDAACDTIDFDTRVAIIRKLRQKNGTLGR
jgi:hypothetical protein